MKNLMLSSLAIFLMVFTSCEKESLDTPGNHNKKDYAPPDNSNTIGVTVPFNLSFQTKGKMIRLPDGVLALEIDGRGSGAYLGNTAWHSFSHVNTDPTPNVQIGDMEFVSASGDKLFGTFFGTANTVDGSVVFEGNYQITHGTGKFFSATGSGTYIGTAAFITANDFKGNLHFSGKLANL